jgi:hypothetical protein
MNAKFRASPAIETLPILTSAPIDVNATSSWVGPAAVLSRKPWAVSARNEPRLTLSVSTWNWSDLKLPFSNSTVARSASVSRSVPSLIWPETGLPGRKRTPPDAKKMLLPLSRVGPPGPNVTPKLLTPTRRSSNSSRPSRRIGWPEVGR